MSFDAYEISSELGEPIELYDFIVGLQHYRFTSADRDVTFSAEDFAECQIERSAFIETAQIEKNDIAITVPRDFTIAQLLREAPPSYVIALNIYRFHGMDTDRKLIWTGRVLNVSWEGTKAILNCESIMTAFKRPLLHRGFGRQCQHPLYGVKCGVVNTAHKIITAIFNVGGVTIEVDTGALSVRPDQYYRGGYLDLEMSPGVITRRSILDHVGDVVTVTHPIPGLIPTTPVEVFPGCDHTFDVCVDKFANGDRNGGWKNMPRRNPWGGNGL